MQWVPLMKRGTYIEWSLLWVEFHVPGHCEDKKTSGGQNFAPSQYADVTCWGSPIQNLIKQMHISFPLFFLVSISFFRGRVLPILKRTHTGKGNTHTHIIQPNLPKLHLCLFIQTGCGNKDTLFVRSAACDRSSAGLRMTLTPLCLVYMGSLQRDQLAGYLFLRRQRSKAITSRNKPHITAIDENKTVEKPSSCSGPGFQKKNRGLLTFINGSGGGDRSGTICVCPPIPGTKTSPQW